MPRVKVPRVGLIRAPIRETAAGKMSPIFWTRKIKAKETKPEITLTILEAWNRVRVLRSGFSFNR